MTIRWYRASSEGAASTSTIRWYRASSEGNTAVVIAPIATRSNLEPETVVVIPATLQAGTADLWTWRRVSGPAVSIATNGPTATVTAPSDINGATLVLGVTATVNGVAGDNYVDGFSDSYGASNTVSPEVTATLNVLPQTEWWWTGTAWVPRIEVWDSGGGSGVPMPTTSNRPGFAYSYGEDFSRDAALGQFGTVYGVNWPGLDGANIDTSGHGSFRPDQTISASNSLLHIDAKYDAASGEYRGSNIYPQPPAGVNGGSQEYLGMRWSIRMRARGAGHGYKTAYLLWPSTYVWDDGEIDFPEGGIDGTANGFSHAAGIGNPGTNTLAVGTSALYSEWHTYTSEWIPKTTTTTGSVEFFLDGTSIGKTTTNVPSKAMHIELKTETALEGTVPPTATAWTIDVDWIVVERYTG